MNFQVALFKLAMMAYYVLKVSLVAAPLTILTVYSRQGGWKYGFTFIQNSLEVGIFGAFSIGFVLGLYHALSFEMVGQGPIENYLKTKQKVKVKSDKDPEEVKALITNNIRHRGLEHVGNRIEFKKLARFMKPDEVVLNKLEDGRYEIQSRPFSPLLFIDFARNFKNVKEIAKLLQS